MAKQSGFVFTVPKQFNSYKHFYVDLKKTCQTKHRYSLNTEVNQQLISHLGLNLCWTLYFEFSLLTHLCKIFLGVLFCSYFRSPECNSANHGIISKSLFMQGTDNQSWAFIPALPSALITYWIFFEFACPRGMRTGQGYELVFKCPISILLWNGKAETNWSSNVLFIAKHAFLFLLWFLPGYDVAAAAEAS